MLYRSNYILNISSYLCDTVIFVSFVYAIIIIVYLALFGIVLIIKHMAVQIERKGLAGPSIGKDGILIKQLTVILEYIGTILNS